MLPVGRDQSISDFQTFQIFSSFAIIHEPWKRGGKAEGKQCQANAVGKVGDRVARAWKGRGDGPCAGAARC